MSKSLTLAKLQKLVASISLTALVASLLVVPSVTQAHWADAAYAALGDTTQSARYEDSMNKCEFSAMLTRAFDLEQEVVANDFTDVPAWCEPYVGAMLANHFASGRNATTFGAADNMPRGEAFKMLANALGTVDAEVPAGHSAEFVGMEWAEAATGGLVRDGFVTGDDNTGNLRPYDHTNRAEGFVLAWRAGGEPAPVDPPVTVEGDLMVSLSSDTPVAKSIPKNGFEIPFTTIRLSAEASSNPVTVTQLELSRAGLGSASDFTRVKLYVGDTQVGSERTISTSTNTAIFPLTSNALVVPAKGFVDVEVRGDMAGGAIDGSEHRLGLASMEAVTTAGGAVGGSFPIFGQTMTLANVSVGSLTVALTDVSGDLEVGDTDEVLGRVQLTASSAEDVTVTKLRYKQTGSANNEDLANLKLYHGAIMVAENPTWDGDYAVFNMVDSPLSINKGDDVNLVLRGDVVGGINNTVGFKVKDAKDVIAYGNVLGFRANITEDTTTAITSRDIVGGALNFSLSASNPPSQDVGIGAENVEFMRFNVVTAGDAVVMQDFDLSLTPATAAASELTDIKVSKLNADGTVGATVAGPVDGSETTGSTLEIIDFTDDWDVPAQTTQTYVVTADVATAVSASDTFIFAIDVSGVNAEYVSTGDAVATADITPSTDVTGSTMTVAAPTLTVSLASTPQSKTVVKNSTDVEIAGFNLKANTVSDLTVTSLTLTQYTAGTDDYQDVSNIRLFEKMADGSLVSLTSSKGLTSNATPTAVFSSLNKVVTMGNTIKVVAVADIPSSATATNTFGLGIAASNISAQDEKGRTSTVTVSGLPVNNTPTVVVTIAGAGSLAAALDGDTPTASVFSTGTTGNPVTDVRFSATNEAFEVTKFQITTDNSSDADEVESFTATYTNEAGTEVSLTESINTLGTASFAVTSGNGVYVPAAGDATLHIKANLNSEATGADSGTTLGVDLDFDTNFEAFGLGSNSRVTSVGTANIQGSNHAVYAAELLANVSTTSPSSSGVTEGSGQTVFQFDLTAKGENTPSVMAAAVTVSGTATLDTTNATGAATLLNSSGNVVATESYVSAGAAGVSDGGSASTTTIGFDMTDTTVLDGIPIGANVLIYDASATTYYSRTIATLPSTGDVTFTPAIASYDDAITDTMTYLPLQPGSGKLYFGAATPLGGNLADAATTVTLASTAGFALGDSLTVRGATSTGLVIECTMATITNLTATVATASAAACTSDLTIVYNYDTTDSNTVQTAVAYVGLIGEEVSGTETFTVKGDLTGATPSSGTKTVQLRINAGSDLSWNDDWSDLTDDMDNAYENTSFIIQNDNLNQEETGYTNFPQTGAALSFQG